MATSTTPFRITKDSQDAVVRYFNGLMEQRADFDEIYTKMEIIDKAYARYQATQDTDCGSVPCDVFASDNIVAPIVVSQVETMVGYLAEVFVSGYPLFPVVSTPAKRKYAEQLETLLDDHAVLGGYARQLLIMLRDAVKYNICAIEADWTAINQFSVLEDWTTPEAPKIQKDAKYYTALKRLDLYNTFWDRSVVLGDVASQGDYAGYIEVLSHTKLKRLLNRYTSTREVYNASEAEASGMGAGSSSAYAEHYRTHPTVSKYVSPNTPGSFMDWEQYILGRPNSKKKNRGIAFEVATFYSRILPSDFGISSPQPNTPQVWKFVVVNSSVVIHAKRIISAYDNLPILFGQSIEDGLGYQTQSTAEGSIPFQQTASALFNIRLNFARRAVSDRALYDPTMIRPSDVNSPSPAAKIPVALKPLENKGLESAYRPIPFDSRGTEGALQDAQQMAEFSKQLSGLNNAQQGLFQKGNKSVQEFQQTMGNSESRLRLGAIALEHQIFVPLKQILALNIFQNGENVIAVSQKTGEVLDINIKELRKEVLAFRIADGYTPKAKLASTDMIVQGLNVIMNSPILQQAYGTSLPSLFAHMMQLGGVRGLEEYAPEVQQQAVTQSPEALETQQLQEGAPANGSIPSN